MVGDAKKMEGDAAFCSPGVMRLRSEQFGTLPWSLIESVDDYYPNISADEGIYMIEAHSKPNKDFGPFHAPEITSLEQRGPTVVVGNFVVDSKLGR